MSMEHIKRNIADRISGELIAQQRSQRWLAEKTGMPLSTLHRSLIAKRSLEVTELFEIAKALDISVTSIIQAAEQKLAA